MLKPGDFVLVAVTEKPLLCRRPVARLRVAQVTRIWGTQGRTLNADLNDGGYFFRPGACADVRRLISLDALENLPGGVQETFTDLPAA